jgi:hypothetical protein
VETSSRWPGARTASCSTASATAADGGLAVVLPGPSALAAYNATSCDASTHAAAGRGGTDDLVRVLAALLPAGLMRGVQAAVPVAVTIRVALIVPSRGLATLVVCAAPLLALAAALRLAYSLGRRAADDGAAGAAGSAGLVKTLFHPPADKQAPPRPAAALADKPPTAPATQPAGQQQAQQTQQQALGVLEHEVRAFYASNGAIIDAKRARAELQHVAQWYLGAAAGEGALRQLQRCAGRGHRTTERSLAAKCRAVLVNWAPGSGWRAAGLGRRG